MISIAPLQLSEIAEVGAAHAVLNKSVEQYQRYFEEQQAGRRLVLIARSGGAVAGYVTINWQPDYAPFRDAGVPEIQDFNVLPAFRRRAIGTKLMDEAERLILERSSVIGIGVGLHHDYGAAQRLYVMRGYVPDARGITAHSRRVNWGDEAKIDDDLVLWFTKTVS
jgi:GNAT superfamily N-acetyltransferase